MIEIAMSAYCSVSNKTKNDAKTGLQSEKPNYMWHIVI